MTESIDSLLARVRLADSRPPRREAIAAIRALERAVIDALAGQTLRGLPNLGTGSSPFLGANVRGATYTQRVPFPGDAQIEGNPVLVLRPDARLAMAWTVRSATTGRFDFVHHGAEDDNLLVEDLTALVTLLPKVLTEHLVKAERTQAGWAATRTLAHRVLDLVSSSTRRSG
ncbi:MAG TPA: hypothetical protein VF183_07265 [Acidimicrobiales bacterium]